MLRLRWPMAKQASYQTYPFLSTSVDESQKGLLSGFVGRLHAETDDGVVDLESQTLFQKGAAIASSSFVFITDSARTAAVGAQSRLEDTAVTLNPQRVAYFAVCVGFGCLFMIGAFMFLPVVMLFPKKFALMFTAGSICIITGLVFLKGTKRFITHFASLERLPYTGAYTASLLLTLYATLVVKSNILTLFFSIIQIASLITLLASYMPGGTRGIRACLGFCEGFLRHQFGLG